MKKELNLKKKTIYAVRAAADERTTSIVGYYDTLELAEANTAGVGWWGAHGNVVTLDLYQVNSIGILVHILMSNIALSKNNKPMNIIRQQACNIVTIT